MRNINCATWTARTARTFARWPGRNAYGVGRRGTFAELFFIDDGGERSLRRRTRRPPATLAFKGCRGLCLLHQAYGKGESPRGYGGSRKGVGMIRSLRLKPETHDRSPGTCAVNERLHTAFDHLPRDRPTNRRPISSRISSRTTKQVADAGMVTTAHGKLLSVDQMNHEVTAGFGADLFDKAQIDNG